ncbi:hypothetical protein NLI96_g12788 [Meripilus lineatus]|uniref:Uncharacterized protein n=1 Tax=Meripilus lineatus TaxID=2056292 RepID=A0AAD5YC26_9APHY|nr:hypothetical protein NLI96_g12788 [Physisporinus lineatus]
MADLTVSFTVQNLTPQTIAPIQNSDAYYVLDNGKLVDGKAPREVSPNSTAEGGTYSHKPPKLAVAVAYTIPDKTHYAVFFYQNDDSGAPVAKTLFVPSRDFKLDSGFVQYMSTASAFGIKAQHGFYMGPNYFVLKMVAHNPGNGNVKFTISSSMDA